jgi:glutamine amidotransferase
MIHPIVDGFYSPNPAHERSAGFAQAKGQTVTGPDKRVLTESETPESKDASPRRSLRAGDVVSGAIQRLRVE